MTDRRGPWSNLAGPRLPASPKAVAECWRCAEDRRILRPFRLLDPSTGHAYRVQLCGACIAGLPRDPDPLDVTEAA